jgi:hypothetical protein
VLLRRYERQKVDLPVNVRTTRDGISSTVKGHCVNLSQAGAGCIVAGRLRPGDFVLLEIAMPANPEPMLVSARVRHQDRMYCGLEFVAPSYDVSDGIRRACVPPAVYYPRLHA